MKLFYTASMVALRPAARPGWGRQLLLSLALLPTFAALAQNPAVPSTTSFTGIANNTSYVSAQPSPATAANVSGTGWTFTGICTSTVSITASAGSTTGTQGALGAGDPFIRLARATSGATDELTEARVKTSGGLAFKLNSVALMYSIGPDGPATFTLTGYRAGVAVSGATLAQSGSARFTWLTFNTSSIAAFNNIDEFRATLSGVATGTVRAFIGVDEINIAAAVVPNQAPVIANQTRSVAENSANGTNVGAVVTASDPDAGQTLTYAITGGNAAGKFAINASTGQLTVAGALDFETVNSYALTVQVTDNATTPASSSATVTVSVTDVPAPSLSSLSQTSGPVGTSVTLTGTDFAGITGVSFGSTAATTFSFVNATTATATVPAGASTGLVTISTGEGTSNGVNFTVTTAPTVTTTAPASIATTSATLGGNVTNDGGAAITERGVVYVAGTGTPTTANTKLTAAGTTGAYTVSATGLTAGTQYTVRAYATNSQGTSYGANQTFTTAATLAASISSQTNVSCNAGTNGAATVTATGGVTPYTYSWNTTPVQTTATATGLAAGTYTVTVTDAASQTTTATATIAQPAALAATTGQTNVACFGGSTGAASVSVSGGTPSYTYSWNTNPVRTTAAITGLPAGTYTVTVTDNNSCTLTRSVTITQPGSALAATASKTDATTNGGTNGTATANVSGGTPGYTYSWNTSPVQTTATATGLAAGTYTVTVTDANNCTTTASATVGQPAALTVSTGTVNGSPFCAGSAISVPFTASAAPNSGNVYTAQLSTASGSFASPVSIGTLSSTATSGTVSGTVPTSTAQGSGYRVRVVASSPATTGTDNGANLTVNNTAAPTGSASQSFSSGATVANLVATGTAIQWYAASTGGSPLASTTTLTNGTTYYATQTANGCESLTRLAVTVTINAPANLTISTGSAAAPVSIAAGTYNDITITGAGFGQLTGSVVVGGTFAVQGSLDTNCQSLTGSGSFALAAGGTLTICDAAGLTTSGNTGAVQTATRSFATDASYVYNGTAAQATGNGLPTAVRNLTTTNANAVTLTAPTGVAQTLTIGGAGNLVLNGQALTLLSDATGTALVVNSGAGTVSGTATVQRYIGVNTGGNGYRHYSSPVQNETFSTLATAGYTPDFSGAAAYNSSLTPGTVTPFPTVFRYNQDRIAGSGSNYSVFDKGFEAVTNTVGDNAMEVGRGYAVNAPGSALVDFAGTLTTGPVTRPGLNRASADANTGWHLLGNPYPAPLDWSTLTQGAANTDNLQNMDGAVYVFQSAGPYTGTYRTYLKNAPSGNSSPLIPAGSGFFVHTTTPGTAGTVRLTDANRVTTFGAQPAFGRGTADTRPLVQLALRGASGMADAFTAYATPGATSGTDAAFDARKLPNSTGLNLASATAAGEALAIDGRPAFAAGTVLPLTVGVPAAGAYTLTAAAVNNLPAGLDAFLSDAATGRVVNLRTQPAYAFTVSATQAAATLAGRFTLSFGAAAPLATSSALAAAQVLAYPNPAHDRLTVVRPLGTAASAVLLNALGQVVRRVALPTAETTLDLRELATGVYVLRLTLDGEPVTKRVVVE